MDNLDILPIMRLDQDEITPSDAVEQFNARARNGEWYGGRNIVLDRIHQFDMANASRYSDDPNDESEYGGNTLYLPGMTDDYASANSEFSVMPPEIQAADYREAQEFMNSFGQVFAKN